MLFLWIGRLVVPTIWFFLSGSAALLTYAMGRQVLARNQATAAAYRTPIIGRYRVPELLHIVHGTLTGNMRGVGALWHRGS